MTKPIEKEEIVELSKEERREKEKEAVKKQVEDAAAAHAGLPSKWAKEDAEEKALEDKKKVDAEAKANKK
jgi:hypothetical protein